MSSKSYKKIIIERLHALLKPKKFIKKGNTFEYSNGDLTYYINLQSSQSSTLRSFKVTINIYINSLLLYELEETSLTLNQCQHFTKRIGEYINPPFDKWWNINSEDTAFLVAEEISKIIENVVLQDFSSLTTTEHLFQLWDQNECPGLTEYQRQDYLSILKSKLPGYSGIGKSSTS